MRVSCPVNVNAVSCNNIYYMTFCFVSFSVTSLREQSVIPVTGLNHGFQTYNIYRISQSCRNVDRETARRNLPPSPRPLCLFFSVERSYKSAKGTMVAHINLFSRAEDRGISRIARVNRSETPACLVRNVARDDNEYFHRADSQAWSSA